MLRSHYHNKRPKIGGVVSIVDLSWYSYQIISHLDVSHGNRVDRRTFFGRPTFSCDQHDSFSIVIIASDRIAS